MIKQKNMELPKAFIDYMDGLMGQEASNRLQQGLQEAPQVSIRMNEAKIKSYGRELSLPASGSEPVPWCATGYYLHERPSFTFDPLLHAGAYYVQEAGSMFLEQAFKSIASRLSSDSPLMALDLCAAPGGKSTHLRSLLPEGSFLVSNEPMRPRAQVLSENMQKWGNPDGMVTQAFPADFTPLEHLFDVIVTDVPCSGEGMFRKDEGAIADWSPENVNLCHARQRSIIEDIWPTLKPGGFLVYSTCTFNAMEDEDNVLWIAKELGADLLPIACAAEWNVQGDLTGRNLPVYHFLPGWTRGEGFFLALLQKHGCADEAGEGWRKCLPRKTNKKGKNERPAVSFNALEPWIDGRSWEWFAEGTEAYAVSSCWAEACKAIKECASVLHAGVPVAELKGRDWMPRQGLALSCACRREAFVQAELTYDQSIAYLRKEALVLPADLPKGYVLLTYKQFPLGFAKQIGNRANNLYPDAWRIRSGHVTPCELFP